MRTCQAFECGGVIRKRVKCSAVLADRYRTGLDPGCIGKQVDEHIFKDDEIHARSVDHDVVGEFEGDVTAVSQGQDLFLRRRAEIGTERRIWIRLAYDLLG